MFPTLLSIIWLVMFFLTDSFSDFPLNDDWVHAKSVKTLVEEGRFELIDYCGSTIIFQVLWGALFCLFGFSFIALRVSMLVMGLIGIITFYRIVLKFNANQKVAFFITLVMAVNPIYFSLAGTFMTDVPFVTLCLLTIYYFIKLVETEKYTYFIHIVLLSICATMVRQIGLLVPLSLIFPFLTIKKDHFKPLLYAIASFVVVYLCYQWYLYYLSNNQMMPSYFSGGNVLLKSLTSKKVYANTLLRIGRDLFYVGLVSLPISLLLIKKGITISWKKVIILGVVLFLLAKALPRALAGNVFNNFYIGPLTFTDSYLIGVNRPGQMVDTLFDFIKLLSSVGIVLFCLQLYERWQEVRREKGIQYKIFIGIISFCIVYSGILLFSKAYFERYLLPVYFTSFLLLPLHQITFQKKVQWSTFTVFITAMLYFTIAGTHDYQALNRARWAAADFLKNEHKITPSFIDGGYEYNGWHKYDKNFKVNKGGNPWWNLGETFIITYGNLAGTKTLKEFSYYSILSMKKKTVKILKRYPFLSGKIPVVLEFGAEAMTPDSTCLLTDNNQKVVESAVIRSENKSHTGDYSLCLTKNIKATSNYVIENVRKANLLGLTVWCYGNTAQHVICNINYRSRLLAKLKPRILKVKDGWSLLSFEYFSTKNTAVLGFQLETKMDNTYIDDIKIYKTKH